MSLLRLSREAFFDTVSLSRTSGKLLRGLSTELHHHQNTNHDGSHPPLHDPASGSSNAADRPEGENAQDLGNDGALEIIRVEMEHWRDRALRAMAELENQKRIHALEVERANKFGISGFAKDLLDVADNMTRALEAVSAGDPAKSGNPRREDSERDREGGTSWVGLLEGVEATNRQLNAVFERHGLSKYGEVGDPFDPNLHEALFTVPTAERQPGTVAAVMKVGYLLNGRVIRPAKVGVSARPANQA